MVFPSQNENNLSGVNICPLNGAGYEEIIIIACFFTALLNDIIY